MDPMFLHAKRVTNSFRRLVEISKNENEDVDLREEADEIISSWPKCGTFCIKNTEDALLVTWSKVSDDDTFSRSEGKKIAGNKMTRLVENPPRTLITLDEYIESEIECYGDSVNPGIKSFLFDHLPACMADTLPWYFNRAIRYYKINDNKKVIIEGSTQKCRFSTYPEQRTRVGLIVYSNDILGI